MIIAIAIAPAAARAATVEVDVDDPGYWAGVEYRAAAGEANRVELFTVSDTSVRVVDPGAAIAPGAGCASVDAHTAICSTAGFHTQRGRDVRRAEPGQRPAAPSQLPDRPQPRRPPAPR